MAMAMAKSVAAVKSSVYSVQLSLLDGISDEEKLRAAGKVLTQSEYADVVTERTIINMCGYPLCANPLPSTFPHKGRYHISLREHKVFDSQETRLFCSSDCFVASKAFAASLSVERDHSSKTLELAAAFHNLCVQDVEQQNQESSLSQGRARPLIEELDEQFHQNAPIPVALSVPVKTGASQQFQQANPGTVLFIREENELKVIDVNTAGPSNAIEGYVPQKELRSFYHKPMNDQDKNNSSKLASAKGNSSNKKGKSEKVASASKFKELARRVSFEKELDFRSCILFDYGETATIHDANCKCEPASSSIESSKEPSLHMAMDEEVPMHSSACQQSKRSNRVSWADHKNLNLVEELSPFNAASGRGIDEEACNVRGREERNQALMPDKLTIEKGVVAVKGGNGLLQRQEGFCVRKEQDNKSSHDAMDGRSNASLQAQESFSCRKEHEDMQGTRVYKDDGDAAAMPNMVTSMKTADPVRGSVASPQRREHLGDREEPENIQSADLRGENSECPKALIASVMEAVVSDVVTLTNEADPAEGNIASPQGQEAVGGREELENIQSTDDLECAKALITALTEAAEAVAHDGVDSSEAAARAGISILPNHEVSTSHFSKEMKNMKDIDKELADDVENLDPRKCWYSAPPKDFKPELSMFGTLWMALDSWISAASIAHVYGRDSSEEDNFTLSNGKEYLRQVIISNGVSAEIERTLAGYISRTLPGLVEIFRFPVPVSTLEVSLGRFLRTMSFMSAIPAFSSKQWQVVVLLLLDALSVHRLPAVRTRFLNGRQSVQKVLVSANITEAEYEIFRDLVLPMGILPDFASHCGG
ncbi:hypothetical protein L7F22_021990 [Adiantum nelumboides]|nr:hypothetical protein [Adiantum nelumboides]